jgi:hypothetical protein
MVPPEVPRACDKRKRESAMSAENIEDCRMTERGSGAALFQPMRPGYKSIVVCSDVPVISGNTPLSRGARRVWEVKLTHPGPASIFAPLDLEVTI